MHCWPGRNGALVHAVEQVITEHPVVLLLVGKLLCEDLALRQRLRPLRLLLLLFVLLLVLGGQQRSSHDFLVLLVFQLFAGELLAFILTERVLVRLN